MNRDRLEGEDERSNGKELVRYQGLHQLNEYLKNKGRLEGMAPVGSG